MHGGGGFVLGSLSGAWAHSEARLEAPGFIPAQWVAAAVLAGRAGGFKPLSQRQSSMVLAEENESREARPYTLIIRVYRRLKQRDRQKMIAAESEAEGAAATKSQRQKKKVQDGGRNNKAESL